MLYYPLDEGQGNVAADASGNKLDGVVSADWTDSPSGKALSFDGQPAGIVKVQLPVGRGSARIPGLSAPGSSPGSSPLMIPRTSAGFSPSARIQTPIW